MYTDKTAMLRGAAFELNRVGQPWLVTVEGDSVVARWNWMDGALFAPHEVNDEVREYAFTVTLKDNGKFKERDHSAAKSQSAGFSNGKLNLGGSSSSFSGKQTGKSVTFGAGVNRQSGEFGIVGFRYSTAQVKAQLRDWLTRHGWEKAGLFG